MRYYSSLGLNGLKYIAMQSEENLHKSVVMYLDLLSNIHGEILYTSDMSGVFIKGYKTKKKAAALRRRKGVPDLMIFEPRGEYKGLFIELKAEGTTVFKKDGEIVSNKHFKEQYEYITMLNDRGYYATFASGIDEALKVINNNFDIEEGRAWQR